ncbi:MAG: DUF5050 domain-containing protein [Bacilli bacterium]|nr:DUF5050 domain-containing protein [Bacilli bacterium]
MCEKNTLIIYCPECGNQMNVDTNKNAVTCNCCGTSFLVKDLVNGNLKKDLNFNNDDLLLNQAAYISDPAGGLIYLDNFILKYDWEKYQFSSKIMIDEIVDMINKSKIKFPNNPQSYFLEFEGIYQIILKKIEGLEKIEEKIINNYKLKDLIDADCWFDLYSIICKKLLELKPQIIKSLEETIAFVSKLEIENNKVIDLEDKLKDFKVEFNKVILVNKIEEIASINDFIEKEDLKLHNEYLEKGIDAKTTYLNAVRAFELDHKQEALHLFQTIPNYKNSEEYINKINLVSRFYNLVSFGDNKLYRIVQEAPLFSVAEIDSRNKKKNKQKEEEEYRKPTFTYYSIVNNKPSENIVLKGVTSEICVYGTKLFYIEEESRICCYDFDTFEITVLDEGVVGSYVDFCKGNLYGKSNDGQTLLFKKKLQVETKKGCSLFKKKKIKPKRNNYEVFAIDLKTNTKRLLIHQLVEVMDYYNNVIFFQRADEVVREVKKNKTVKTSVLNFYAYNFEIDETEKILDENCEIYNVIDSKIIFGRYNRDYFNISLLVLDLETKQEVLLEKNIYQYLDTIDNRIYYTIGSVFTYCLYGIDLDGKERTEIIYNSEKICFIKDGWIYLFKSFGSNKALIKVNVIENKKVVLCRNLKDVLKYTHELIYYLDFESQLHILTSDGSSDKVIASDIDTNNLIIDSDGIYFLKNECMGVMVDQNNDENNYFAKSMYKLDLNGNNIRKLYYNVFDISEFGNDKILIFIKENILYKFTTPLKNGKTDITYENRMIDRYVIFDKQTENCEDCLLVGVPNPDKVEIKRGCLKKKVFKEVLVDEVLTLTKNIRKGVTTVDQITAEAIKEEINKEGVTEFKEELVEDAQSVQQINTKKGCFLFRPVSLKRTKKNK